MKKITRTIRLLALLVVNIPAEYEGWQAIMSESVPVCGVVTDGVVSCEFVREDKIKGAWLHLYKGTETVSFYVDFYVPGKKEVVEPKECQPQFTFFGLFNILSNCDF